MPIYEYICKTCDKNFEILKKITEEPTSTCPECRGPMEKLISQSSFHLKGTGWFKETSAPKDSKKTADSKTSKPPQDCGASACESKSPKESCSSS